MSILNIALLSLALMRAQIRGFEETNRSAPGTSMSQGAAMVELCSRSTDGLPWLVPANWDLLKRTVGQEPSQIYLLGNVSV